MVFLALSSNAHLQIKKIWLGKGKLKNAFGEGFLTEESVRGYGICSLRLRQSWQVTNDNACPPGGAFRFFACHSMRAGFRRRL
jgi:hypothetical protein